MSVLLDGRVEQGSFTLEVSLPFESGTVTGILGPNGSGKTTLLRAIAGLTPLTSGTLTVDDSDWTSLAPQDRSVGLVLADPVLFPHLSATDNVAFGPRSRGVATSTARQRALEELDALGIADLASRKPKALSTGQAQRVALARALATDPAVLLLDESLAGLDPQTRTSVRGVLASRLAHFDGTTIMVTHDAVDALTLADELVFLEDGRLTQRGTPAQVSAAPRSTYAATLVGLNLLPGNATGDGLVATGLGEVRTTSDVTGGCWVSIRPNAVSLWRSPPEGSPRNAWQMTVIGVEVLGQTARVMLSAGDARLVAEVTTLAVNELGLVAGAQVWASVKATEIDCYPR